MTAQFRTWNDYFIPGTEVLRNLMSQEPYGLSDPLELERAELAATWARVVELGLTPATGPFDYDRFLAIHRHIFQDVYAWAGQPRVGPVTRMTKSAPDVVHYALGDPNAEMMAYAYYAAGPDMEHAARRQFDALAHLLQEPGTDAQFLTNLAEVWAELNVAHTFREGNTRTQIVFFADVLEASGFTLDVAALAPEGELRDEFVAGRLYSQATGSSSWLAQVLTAAVSRPARTPQLKLAAFRKIVPKEPPGR